MKRSSIKINQFSNFKIFSSFNLSRFDRVLKKKESLIITTVGFCETVSFDVSIADITRVVCNSARNKKNCWFAKIRSMTFFMRLKRSFSFFVKVLLYSLRRSIQAIFICSKFRLIQSFSWFKFSICMRVGVIFSAAIELFERMNLRRVFNESVEFLKYLDLPCKLVTMANFFFAWHDFFSLTMMF